MFELDVRNQQVAGDFSYRVQEAQVGVALDTGELKVADDVGAVLVALEDAQVVFGFVVRTLHPVRGARADAVEEADAAPGRLGPAQLVVVAEDMGQLRLLVAC